MTVLATPSLASWRVIWGGVKPLSAACPPVMATASLNSSL
jgi:hypothetical protein